MAKHTVVTMPGDGIGNQVLPEAIRVLRAVEFDADYVHADIGWECWRKEGNAFRSAPVICWPGISWDCLARSLRSPRSRPKPSSRRNSAARVTLTSAQLSRCANASISTRAFALAFRSRQSPELYSKESSTEVSRNLW